MPKINPNNNKDVALEPIWLEFHHGGKPFETNPEEACPTCGHCLMGFIPDDSRCSKCGQLIDFGTWPSIGGSSLGGTK